MRWLRPQRAGGLLLGGGLVLLLALPFVGLGVAVSPAAMEAGLSAPSSSAALGLSLATALASVGLIVVTGTPLAWWLAGSTRWPAQAVSALVQLPIVVPPAVIGVALLVAFGRRGLVGAPLDAIGVQIAFRPAAVVLAQVVVAAPFFVQAAASAFREIDRDLLIVARTLGASPARAFFTVALPLAARGLLVGAGLAWTRALGEFGATLLFAGNLPGRTQTMPLAIYSALESDVGVAVALSWLLVGLGAGGLGGLRLLARSRT